MKYKLRYLLAVGLLAGIFALTPVAIAYGESGSGSTDSGSSSDDSKNESEDEKNEREDRLEKLKQQLKINLSLAQKNALKKVCRPAQSVVSRHKNHFGNNVTKRTRAYTQLQKNLDKLVEKLKAKGVDTTELEQEITVLKEKISKYTEDLTAYQQTLSDLKAVDCLSDPDAFQAALEAARSAHLTLIEDTVDIKTYVKGTIKPTLLEIRKTLAEDANKEEDQQNESDTPTEGDDQ